MSAFATLCEGKIEGIIRLAMSNTKLPLTELDQALLAEKS